MFDNVGNHSKEEPFELASSQKIKYEIYKAPHGPTPPPPPKIRALLISLQHPT